ncbi:hypothetical protein RYX36_006565 [Vicia faba]
MVLRGFTEIYNQSYSSLIFEFLTSFIFNNNKGFEGKIVRKELETFTDSERLIGDVDKNQVINEFVEKERIPFDGVRPAEILFGRDTRPSGEALLEAADKYRHHKLYLASYYHFVLFYCQIKIRYVWTEMKGVTSIVGVISSDMGIWITPQLHWMVHAKNKGIKALEQDYFEQLSNSFKLV